MIDKEKLEKKFESRRRESDSLPDSEKGKFFRTSYEENPPRPDLNKKISTCNEVLPAGEEWEGVPDGVKDLINTAIYDFCNYECSPPIEDLSRERQTRWTACAQYIGNTVFKRHRLLYSDSPDGGRRVDSVKVFALIPVWIAYTNKFNKATLPHVFFYFVGLEWLLWDNASGKYGAEVTALYANLRQKLTAIEKGGLKDSIVDGARNPTGAIAILNNEHGYSRGVQTIQIETKNALTADRLPVLGAITGGGMELLETNNADEGAKPL